jgi:uncharacterized protein
VKLEHSFSVPADLDTVWAAVLDPERVAPCMPGAALSEVDGDTFKGTVKVKVGPISLQYKGSGEFLEKDAAARKLVIKAAGKDTRGNGTASATVTVTLRAEGDGTAGSVDTDLSITGKPAQFGRGLISEVGGKILDTFATCLATKLAPEAADDAEDAGVTQASKASKAPKAPTPPTPPKAPTPPKPPRAPKPPKPPKPPKDSPNLSVVAPEAAPAAAAGTSGTTQPAAERAKPKLAAVEPRPETEPIDLLAYAGPSVAKRVVPLVVAVVLLLAVVRLLRRRS